MKKIVRNAVIAVFVLIAGLGMAKAVALAAEVLELAIPVSISNSGAVPSAAETYRVLLKADDISYPMPEGSVDGVYTLEVKGAQKSAFPKITFSRLGVYSYTVWQEKGGNSLCTYDDAVYNVKVYIVNSDDGGFASTVAVRKEGAEDKEDIIFENIYAAPPVTPAPEPETEDPDVPVIIATSTIAVTKKWNDDGKDRPASVTVQLLNGETVCDTVTLDNWNNWTYKWDELDKNGQWMVKEINIPNGYTPSYSSAENTITITNTKTLIKTGQMNWPIPVLAFLGLAILLAGAVILKEERKNGRAS